MVTRVTGTLMAAMVLFGSAAWAQSPTDSLQSDRLTVVKIDKASGAVLLKNGVSASWHSAGKRDIDGLGAGDIVRVSANGSGHTITILRRAADEIASPE